MDSGSGKNSDATKNCRLVYEGVSLPILEYGYRTEPFDWPELVDIIERQKDLGRLCRSLRQQKEYELQKLKIKESWMSITDQILCSKFGFERRKSTEEPTLYHAYPPLSDITSVRTTLGLNDFPYCLPDHIEHWLLWKLGGRCSDDDIESAKVEIRSRHGEPSSAAFLHWTNPPQYQSLPDIDHVHILYRRETR